MQNDPPYNYQLSGRYFAQIADGMEELGTRELDALGGKDVKPGYRGLFFTAEASGLYRVNYCARTITRVLAPLVSFDCHSTKYLYKTAYALDWPALFSLEHTFAVSANVSNSQVRHSQYAALCLKDAIVDKFRDRLGARPNVERLTPDVHLNLNLARNHAVISLDTSGGSLHRRGYRQTALGAPMQETLAAAVIALSAWDGERPLYDPLCGSGTLLCEALMRYCRIPAGYLRERFGFEFLPDYDAELWQRVRREADGLMRALPEGLIRGSDQAPTAIAAARTNCRALPYGEHIRFRQSRFQDLGDIHDSTIVCNPPYGRRMGKDEDLTLLMKELGDFLKNHATGSSAYVYFGNRELMKSIGLRTAWKKPLRNGPLDGRLARFDLF